MQPPATEQLTLREFRAEDAKDLLTVFTDDYARRFYPEMTTEAAATEWIDRNLKRYAEHGFGLWAVIEKSTGRLIGDCGPTWQDIGGPTILEIGYHIAPDRRGRGFALEAARACLATAFASTSEPEIGSIVAPENASSMSVARRLHRERRSYVNSRGLDRFLFFTRR
ncbi:GNAT family N-acetyltransferase [Mesorhizobium sp. CGMCC 1.15528]|uniref:GNAT family N-acetyltransferase n=1 Tax=Mesorhizobium zhangyense TaxID=1776730 RepID=A0A7C9RE36_9HYPH|nr:GNAT family N-acetyltransferase [Mesorhizobium zhangyense]NGN44413.1 GNAT family N-acetyltransferase [Mesorhizobium zhangyense]